MASEDKMAGGDERKWKWEHQERHLPMGRQLVAKLTASYETQTVPTGRKSAPKTEAQAALWVHRGESYFCDSLTEFLLHRC